jgi:hypothetical protein
MITLPIVFRDGHLFVEIEGWLWLFDTGAPESFGQSNEIIVDGLRFLLNKGYMELSASTLSQFVGVECRGLIGADILGQFDHVIDIFTGTVTISTGDLKHPGKTFALSEFMGIPILTAEIASTDYRMFFDTGAQISYFQEDTLTDFPNAGIVTDFYPGVGQFQTDTYQIQVSLGDCVFPLRCGKLPGLIGATLMMAETSGIIGNQIIENRAIGYFPRRKALCL